MSKKKRMRHKQNIYDIRRRCKTCKKIIQRGTQHIHNKVKIGKL